jgi:hypothetical protein
MSTHFTRRGGTPEKTRKRAKETADERRFTTDRDDEPVSPLVEEQNDPQMRGAAPVRDRAAVGAADWRSAVAAASGLNVLAGIWLIIAPLLLGYGGGDPYWNDIVFGAITGVIALLRLAGAYRATLLSLINALIGVWIFVSAFWLDDTGTASANDVILGAIVFALALAGATASDEDKAAERRGLAA